MRKFVLEAIQILEKAQGENWASLFVKLRLQFHDKFQRKDNLIISTSHGIAFFENLLQCIDKKMTWDEEGLFGNNFRKLVEMGQQELKKGQTVKIITIEPKTIKPIFRPTSEDLTEIEKLNKEMGN